MRVVLDTNVLVAAFIARGVCSDVSTRHGDHELV
jgi:predicted nucleic acid-binding protein